ncbi:6061_t:CDS:1 [Cetraspora pellucida]|uniref:6061_t:CDS:1 n=1 Tax=Cetraspora pellucida TaxID=1433469 RepID=A0ACA9MCH6_9GLOM|nr:6061_t:CDS:1 [Cetraspora pellucida]
MSVNKKYEYSSLSVKIQNLLKSNELNVKLMHSEDKYSIIEVSLYQFFQFTRNLFIWNKEIFNQNDYLDLFTIASKFKKGEWLIVGNSLVDDNSEDIWEQFQIQTNKRLKNNMLYSGEHEIFDILKNEFFDLFVKDKKIRDDQKDLFVHYMKSRTDSFKAIKYYYNSFLLWISNVDKTY